MVELVAVAPGGRHVLRGAAAGAVLEGVSIPAGPCRAAEAGARAALWLGPDEWLLLGFEEVETPFAVVAGAVVEIGDRDAGFRLVGAEAAMLLAGGVPLDLAEAAFPVGMCTRTLFEKVGIVLWRRGAAEWRIEVGRSYAPYLCGMLRAVAAANGIALEE